jgi:succinate-acetate transporter protein
MKGRLSSASSGHRHYMLGFGLALWSAIALVVIMGCFAEVRKVKHLFRFVRVMFGRCMWN